MDIKNLQTFIQVAELSSFSRAGEQLGYSQPTVSVQIRQLEQELGVQLFDRIGHAVRLTEQGHRLLPYAQQVCQLCTQMTEHPAGQQEKPAVIRLATADSLCVPLVIGPLAELRRRSPHILLNVTTAGTNQLFQLLDQNQVDIVCTLDSHIYNNRYIIAAEKRVGLHFVVGKTHPLATKKLLTRQDLLGQNLLLTEKGMSYRRLLDEWLAQGSMELQPALEIGRDPGHGHFLPAGLCDRSRRSGRLHRPPGCRGLPPGTLETASVPPGKMALPSPKNRHRPPE